jgi:hypothetical protein
VIAVIGNPKPARQEPVSAGLRGFGPSDHGDDGDHARSRRFSNSLLTGKKTGENASAWILQTCKTSIPRAFREPFSQTESIRNRGVTGEEQGKNRGGTGGIAVIAVIAVIGETKPSCPHLPGLPRGAPWVLRAFCSVRLMASSQRLSTLNSQRSFRRPPGRPVSYVWSTSVPLCVLSGKGCWISDDGDDGDHARSRRSALGFQRSFHGPPGRGRLLGFSANCHLLTANCSQCGAHGTAKFKRKSMGELGLFSMGYGEARIRAFPGLSSQLSHHPRRARNPEQDRTAATLALRAIRTEQGSWKSCRQIVQSPSQNKRIR